jgi:hypothetical protein
LLRDGSTPHFILPFKLLKLLAQTGFSIARVLKSDRLLDQPSEAMYVIDQLNS